MAKGDQKNEILAKLPVYRELGEQITTLKNSICDKEKKIERSESYYDVKISKYKKRIDGFGSGI